jgi:hypothetical protein
VAGGFLTSFLYVPSITQEPEEVLAQSWVNSHVEAPSAVIAPGFGGEFDAPLADLLVPPTYTNSWYSSLRLMYNGDPRGAAFFGRTLDRPVYVVETEKADRLQGYNGRTNAAGMYAVYAQNEVTVYYLHL